MPAMRRLPSLAVALVLITLARPVIAADGGALKATHDEARGAVSITQGKQVLATYPLRPEKDANLSVESGCYFHPLKTPAGVTVTEVAPADHPHHRGVFFAWVEMRGKVDGDFWGWGQHAPKDGRRIVNRGIAEVFNENTGAGFVANNQWMAGDEVVLDEELRAEARTIGRAT